MKSRYVALGCPFLVVVVASACVDTPRLSLLDGGAGSGSSVAGSPRDADRAVEASERDADAADPTMRDAGQDDADSGVGNADTQGDDEGGPEAAPDGTLGGGDANPAANGSDAGDDAYGDGNAGSDAGGGGTTTSRTLGFTPSNLGDVLDGVDTSKLIDVLIGYGQWMPSDSDYSQFFSHRVVNQRDPPQPPVPGGVVYKLVTQPDGSKIGVYIARSWTMGDAIVYGYLGSSGQYPLALVALTNVYVEGRDPGSGRIDVGGNLNGAGPGGYGGSKPDFSGNGPGGGGAATMTGAGAGGGFCGAGGSGGAVAGGTPPLGGTPYGLSSLVPLQGGSAGSRTYSGNGGGGGGAIELVAGSGIGINGVVEANGGGGICPSGGGAGGAVLLESPSVSIGGAVLAEGGGGPPAPGVTNAPAYQRAGVCGGSGGGDTMVAGGAGADGSPDGGVPPGAGGGGAGYIRINTAVNGLTVGARATISPALGTVCATQGVLAP